jgi:CRP-like cAMP-binding protein
MGATNNLLLDSLSPRSRDLLVSRATPILLPSGTSLYTANETPTFAYFLTSGMASIVVSTLEGETAEVGVVGREGVIGSLHVLGPAPLPTDCMIQIAGGGLRIAFGDFKIAFKSSEEIRERVLEFAQEQALSLSQIAACNRLHEAEPRLARWLLMTQDRVQSDALNFTQAFLANMLGTQRTTVTGIAGGLQQRGVIGYSRGEVRIVDRAGLQDVSCSCYEVFKHLYDLLYKRQED